MKVNVKITCPAIPVRLVSFDVDADEQVEGLKALLEVETQIPIMDQELLFNQVVMSDSKKLAQYGIHDGCTCTLQRKSAVKPNHGTASSSQSDWLANLVQSIGSSAPPPLTSPPPISISPPPFAPPSSSALLSSSSASSVSSPASSATGVGGGGVLPPSLQNMLASLGAGAVATSNPSSATTSSTSSPSSSFSLSSLQSLAQTVGSMVPPSQQSSSSSSSSPPSSSSFMSTLMRQLTQPSQHQLDEAKRFQTQFNDNVQLQQAIRQDDAELADAAAGNDLPKLARALAIRAAKNAEEKRKHLQRLAQLDMNFLDPSAQQEIESQIHQEVVDENYEAALEHMPEALTRVPMLYIDVEINHIQLKAFVGIEFSYRLPENDDVGAVCAPFVLNLVDKRMRSMAVGVGTGVVIGRIHIVPIKIGKSFFNSSFDVMERESMPGLDFMLGLDMLRRHQCIINLRSGTLSIGDEVVPFLAEKDIPKEVLDDQESMIRPPSPNRQLLQPSSGSSGSASSTSSSQSASASGSTTTPGIDEDKVLLLMDMTGAARQHVVNAIKLAEGNYERAASILLSMFNKHKK